MIADARLESDRIATDGTAVATCRVSNVGDRASEAVIQLCARDPVAEIPRPQKEPKGLGRVALAAGENTLLRIEIPAELFAFESRALREAAKTVRAETGLTAADPIASIIAAGVAEAMQAYLAEDMDPLLAAMGELQRRTCPTPYGTLATDPGIDSVALFTDARAERVQNRCGCSLSVRED